MDIRELDWWNRRARKELVIRRADSYTASRIGNVEVGVFQEEMMKLEWENKLIDIEENPK